MLFDLYFRCMDGIVGKVESEFSIDSIVFNDRVLLPYSVSGSVLIVGPSSNEDVVGNDDIDSVDNDIWILLMILIVLIVI